MPTRATASARARTTRAPTCRATRKWRARSRSWCARACYRCASRATATATATATASITRWPRTPPERGPAALPSVVGGAPLTVLRGLEAVLRLADAALEVLGGAAVLLLRQT